MNELPSSLKLRLEKATSLNQYRSLKKRHGIDFVSNDYLGFAQDQLVMKAFLKDISRLQMGSTGSRLLRGNLDIFEKVERDLADFCDREEALLFGSGFQANLALYSSLLTPEDIVFSDEYNHASIIDGIRLSKAQCKIFPHNDLKALGRLLESSKKHDGLKLICTESLFSMEGDLAPLREMAQLAEKNNAYLVVDEAHATGLYGSGLVQHYKIQDRVLASVHTGGKALGVSGAWIAMSRSLKDFLINFSRPFIYSTAPQPLLAKSLSASLTQWKKDGERRASYLKESCAFFISKLREREESLSFSMPEGVSGPIIPVILGSNERALGVAQSLEKKGYDVRAIRPPTVPQGQARLRLTINFNHSEKILNKFLEDLFKVLGKFQK